MSLINLPVSIGEALDKLTILEIKKNKISDKERKEHVSKEYDTIYQVLKPHVEKFPFHYKTLYRLNEEMWDLQDELRVEYNTEKCIETINKNDARFRVKNNLNVLTSSELKEQKGYKQKNALFVGHLGLGDHMCLVGAVRYLSLDWDTMYVVCKRMYLKNVQRMYNDTPNIQCVPVDNENDMPYFAHHTSERLSCSKVFNSGIYFRPGDYPGDNLPDDFYKDLGLDPEIQRTHFWISPPVFSLEIPVPYIFVHQSASNKTVPLVTWDINEQLTIDPNTNLYQEGHPWYRIANVCTDMLIADYTDIIINASEVHVLDSAFYCLARYLPLKASVNMCYDRETGKPSSYTFETNGQ